MEQSFISFQLPHIRINSSDLLLHFHWSPAASTHTGNVTFCAEFTCTNINGIYQPTNISCIIDAADGTAYKHQMTDEIRVVNNLNYSAMCNFRLFRNASDARDTFDADAYLLEFDIHYYAPQQLAGQATQTIIQNNTITVNVSSTDVLGYNNIFNQSLNRTSSVTFKQVTASIFDAGETGYFNAAKGYFNDAGLYTNTIQTNGGDLTINNLDRINAGSGATVSLYGNLELRGNLSIIAGSFTLPLSSSIHSCNSTYRGKMFVFKQYVTQADSLVICVSVNQTSYAWKNITMA